MAVILMSQATKFGVGSVILRLGVQRSTMKISTVLVFLLIFVGCKHFESRQSTSTGTGVICKPQCSEQQINELAEPIF